MLFLEDAFKCTVGELQPSFLADAPTYIIAAWTSRRVTLGLIHGRKIIFLLLIESSPQLSSFQRLLIRITREKCS
jgi:hypothetical protein